jgi:hypothetical protein
MLDSRCESYLKDWSPGVGEAIALQRLPAPMRRFLSDAVEECPEFLEEYVLPALQSRDPYGTILGDMSIAGAAYDLELCGLGTYEGNLGELGHLGKSLWKRVTHALKKSLNPVQAIKGAIGFTKREIKKEVKLTEKIFRKYGAIILTVAGAVLSPFTGGASAAAAAVLIAAQKAYQMKAAADKAKRESRKEAAAMQAQADAQNAQAEQQVDAFYQQNQQWFIDQLGVTPDKWAQLTLQQKIDLINAGASGQVPPNSTPVSAPSGASAPASTPSVSSAPVDTSGSGPVVTTPSIYGPGGPPPPGSAPSSSGPMPPMPPDASAGGGADWGSIATQAANQAAGQLSTQTQAPVAQSSMFGSMSGMMLPAALIAAAVIFTQGGGGSGRRTRRNPRRRRRW